MKFNAKIMKFFLLNNLYISLFVNTLKSTKYYGDKETKIRTKL